MNKIKILRDNFNLSQFEVAQKMGISRTTYISIENGKREMTLPEIEKLAKILGIRTQDLVSTEVSTEKKSTIKFRQVLANCIKFGADDDKKITKTKLAKLIYLCDFANYYYDIFHITNFEYIKLPQGPVTMEFFNTIDEDPSLAVENKGRAQMISLVEEPATSELSKTELALLEKICKKWQNHNTQEIIDFTHRQHPWAMCRDNEVIPYSLIHTEEPNNVY